MISKNAKKKTKKPKQRYRQRKCRSLLAFDIKKTCPVYSKKKKPCPVTGAWLVTTTTGIAISKTHYFKVNSNSISNIRYFLSVCHDIT